MRRSAHHWNVPEPQPLQHILRIANGLSHRDIAVCADYAEQVDIIESRKIRQSQGIVDAGVHVENQFAVVHGFFRLYGHAFTVPNRCRRRRAEHAVLSRVFQACSAYSARRRMSLPTSGIRRWRDHRPAEPRESPCRANRCRRPPARGSRNTPAHLRCRSCRTRTNRP